jgi:hypothetical protein
MEPWDIPSDVDSMVFAASLQHTLAVRSSFHFGHSFAIWFALEFGEIVPTCSSRKVDLSWFQPRELVYFVACCLCPRGHHTEL